jgi:hypothetical protein
MMKRFVAIGLIYLAAVSCIAHVVSRSDHSSRGFVSPVSLQEWQRYTVDGEEFSVSMPVLPAMTTEKTFLREYQKTRTERQIGAYQDGVVYSVRSLQDPLRPSLEMFIGAQFASNNPSDVSINGFAGKQFEYNSRGVKQTSQFFKTKKHLYEFGAAGASFDDPRVKQFFSSITLGEKREGTELNDGIGAVSSVDSLGGEPTYSGKEVDQRVFVAMKPEPSFSEMARQEHVTGTVVLRALFNSKGSVENITAISELPFGLTKRAIAAAKKIKFVPAVKNGQFVSTWLQLEYNFNLY